MHLLSSPALGNGFWLFGFERRDREIGIGRKTNEAFNQSNGSEPVSGAKV